MNSKLSIFVFTLLLSVWSFIANAQKQKKIEITGGLTGYYFWEEDSLGFIKKHKTGKPYLQNFKVRFDTESGRITSNKLKERTLRESISKFAHENKSSRKKRIISDSSETLKIPLKKIPSEFPNSMIITQHDEEWSSRIRQNVLYFNIVANKMRFSHASDSLILRSLEIRIKTEGHYTIYRTFNKNGVIEKEKLYNYAGEQISDSLLQDPDPIPGRYLIFSNGYRGPKKNRDKTDNLITSFDRYQYWYKLDDTIIHRLNPTMTYYIDGSMGVNTSVHKSKLRFGISYAMARIFKNSKKTKRILHTKENEVGFDTRKSEGRIAGRTFLRSRCISPDCEFVKDTVDIVCHSMGYAYSLGFIEEIKDRVIFGKIYILAPESACTDGFDWLEFQEVWQYGSKNNAPMSEQDVVAPQCMVKGLEYMPASRGGQIFIPNDVKFNKILDIHDTKYFDWILNRIPKDSRGFID